MHAWHGMAWAVDCGFGVAVDPPMDLLWISCGFPMDTPVDSLWICCGFAVDFRWIPHGFLIDPPYEFPMDLL